MRMHDWNNYRQQVVAGVGEIAKLSPDSVKGYATLGVLVPKQAGLMRRPVN